MSRFVHYSDRPLDGVWPVDQHKGRAIKPNGLWFSVEGNGDGWSDWTESVSFGRGKVETELTLDLSAMIVLADTLGIDVFHERYRTPMYPDCIGLKSEAIDWCRVATEYAGIIISPYQWDRRFDGAASSWYAGWDCASGCIWHPDAVEELRPRRERMNCPTPSAQN